MIFEQKEWKFVHKNKLVFVFAILLFAFANLIMYLAGNYSSSSAGTQIASDLILDKIAPHNWSFLYVWTYMAVITIFILYPLFFTPKNFPYALNMLSLFIFVRSAFVVMTDLGLPSGAIPVTFPFPFNGLNFTGDLFFSGHTGLPFLGYFIFRENKTVSYGMLVAFLILGATVLVMHEHYSIDVFAAFFIAYGIYRIGEKLRSYSLIGLTFFKKA